jgi:hypothetical protein
LQGLLIAQRECEALRFEALTDAELAAALEGIVARIPPRYPQHEAKSGALMKRHGGGGRPRLVNDAGLWVSA